MKKLISFLFMFSVTFVGLGCDKGNDDDYYPPSDPFVCTVAFVTSTIDLVDATEGLAYADTTTLVASTTGGISPFTYSGTFASASNLFVSSDGDITSGTGGAGTPGAYSATITVTDFTGFCTDTVLVTIDILSSGPAAPRIDQTGTVSHANGGPNGGTDSVAGSALSGLDTVPDFLGVQSNADLLSADRVFSIDIDTDGNGLNATTVNTTNITIFEVSTSTPLATSAYSVAYDTLTDIITVTIPGGAAGTVLVEGGTYVITLSAGITNTNGDFFVIAPTAINSIRFLTTPDQDTLIFEGLSSTGAGCAGCHAGGSPGPAAVGGIADPPPGGSPTAITLNFTRAGGTATMFSGSASLGRENGTVGRNYVSLAAITGFAAFDPNGAILANKLSATVSFGSPMPLGGSTLDGSTLPLGTALDTDPPPTDPDTGAIITEGKFVTQIRSWIRGGPVVFPP